MHADPDQVPEDIPVPPGEDTDDEPTPALPVDPDPGEPARDPAVNTAEAANDPDPEDETLIDEVDKPSEPSGKPEWE